MLRGLFDLDNPLMRFLSRVADVLILNLLFVVCSIPIFTIGASLTALYYCFFKMKDNEDGYLIKRFFHSFKENFKQATIMWLVMLLLAVILAFEFLMYRTVDGTMGTVMRALVFVGLIFWYLMNTYVFALLSRFYNTIGNTFKNAALLMFANGPRSIVIVIIFVAIIAFTLMQTSTIVVWNMILFWILLGFATVVLVNVQFLYPVIQKLMPEETEDDTTPDNKFEVDEQADLSSLGYGPAMPVQKHYDEDELPNAKTEDEVPGAATASDVPSETTASEAPGETAASEAPGETMEDRAVSLSSTAHPTASRTPQ